MTYKYVLILGSNVGDSKNFIFSAIKVLEKKGIRLLQETEVLTTFPRLVSNQASFSNSALLIETESTPLELLSLTQATEHELGRKKREKYGPREIDIDIVWWSSGMWQSAELSIPHAQNRSRPWVRKFLAELVGKEVDIETQIEYEQMNVNSIEKVHDFLKKKKAGEKITMLTCYDYSMAKLLARTSIDTILVGDSLGNVIQGQKNTIPVMLEDIIYHTKAVRRAMADIFITSDLPFMSYQSDDITALNSAGRILKESGADAVKLEGAGRFLKTIEKLVESGIPVMGHLGLTPQSVLAFGGYRLQGKGEKQAEEILKDAIELEKAGVFALVLEKIPADLAEKISNTLAIPVIGIGAGNKTDGQVLVIHDMLGIDPDFQPRFVRHYANLSDIIINATEEYCRDIRSGEFPSEQESY